MWKSVGKTGLSPLSTVSATEEMWQRNLEAATIVDECLKEAFFLVLSFFKIFILQPELINDCLSPSMSKVKYVEWLLVKVPTYRLSELSAISEESLRMTKPGVWAEEPSKQNWVAVPRSKDSGALCDSGIRRTVPMNGTFFFLLLLYLSELYLWQTT